MSRLHRHILNAILRLVRHPRLTLLSALLLAGGSVFLASRYLRISTDQNKLFSPHVRFFHRYLTFIHDFPENEAAYVVLQARHRAHPPATAAWIAAARAIAVRLAAMHHTVAAVDWRIPLQQLGDQRLLFAPWKMVRQAAEAQRQLTPLAALWAARPAWGAAVLGHTRLERFFRAAALAAPTAASARLVAHLAESCTTVLTGPAGPGGVGKYFFPGVGGNPVLAVHRAQAQRAEARCWDENPSRPVQQDKTPGVGASRSGQNTRHFHPEPAPATTPAGVTPAALGCYYFAPRRQPHEHLLLIKVYPRFKYDSLAAVSAPLERIAAAVHQALAPWSREFRANLTGRPVLAADEMRITTHDTRWAEVVAMLVVLAGLVLMLRSLWLALAAGLTLTIAIAWTFGYATVLVGRLNLLSSVFVIALIGIGMDYLIQILVRYRREVRRYERQSAVWARVFRYASPPILTACAGAAGAFFVAVFTSFRGDAELGLIAGGGLLLCLLAGYTVLPALLVQFPPRLKMVNASRRYTDDRPPPKAGWTNFVGLIVWMVLLAELLPPALHIQFNPNLLDLQAPGLPAVKLVRKIPTWQAVVLSPTLAGLAPIAAKLGPAMRQPGSPIRSVHSLLDAQARQRFLAGHGAMLARLSWRRPGAVTVPDLHRIAQAAEALAAAWSAPNVAPRTGAAVQRLQQLGSRLDAASAAQRRQFARRLTAWQRHFVRGLHRFVRTLTPPPLNLARLPKALRRHYVSANGTYALYIQPRYDLWHQANLRAFVHYLQGCAGHPGLIPAGTDLTGIAVQLYHSTEAIRGAFIQATVMALVLVLVLVFWDFRRVGQTLLAISVLLLGLPMLIGIMGLLHLQWNFANFFAMPILIGAGHEYGVFMVHRYRETQHNPRRVWRFWDISERALLLCAFVTCSAFGFLALARDRGIASLGLVMAIGIGCIYLSAVFVVRPLLLWRLARKGVYRSK